MIPSISVTLIHLHHPECITSTTYNGCRGHSPSEFQDPLRQLKDHDITEYERLGFSIRKIAQRCFGHYGGLKTRVQVVYEPPEKEVQAFYNGEISFFVTKLEEELGTRVNLELDLLPAIPDTES